MNSIHHHYNPVRKSLLLSSPFYRWRSWGADWLINLLTVLQDINWENSDLNPSSQVPESIHIIITMQYHFSLGIMNCFLLHMQEYTYKLFENSNDNHNHDSNNNKIKTIQIDSSLCDSFGKLNSTYPSFQIAILLLSLSTLPSLPMPFPPSEICLTSSLVLQDSAWVSPALRTCFRWCLLSQSVNVSWVSVNGRVWHCILWWRW